MSVGSGGAYDVKRKGTGATQHRDCEFLVLDLNHDKAARDAAVTFYQGLYHSGQKDLAMVVRRMLDQTAQAFQEYQDTQRRGARKGS